MATQSNKWKAKLEDYIKTNDIDLDSFIRTNGPSLEAGDKVIYFAIRESDGAGYALSHKKCVFGGKTTTGKFKFYHQKTPERPWYISGDSPSDYIIYRQYRIKELTDAITRLNKKYAVMNSRIDKLAESIKLGRAYY